MKIQYIGGTAQPEAFTVGDERLVKDKVYEAYEAYGRYRPNTRWKVDGKCEGSETAIFRLLNGAGYSIEGPTDYTVTITDCNKRRPRGGGASQPTVCGKTVSKVRVVATLLRGNRRSQMDCGEVVAIATTFLFLDPRSAARRHFRVPLVRFHQSR